MKEGKTRLSEMLRVYIAVNGIEQKEICSQIGISQSSMTRLLQGRMLDTHSFSKLMVWLTSYSKEQSEESE